MAKQGIIVTGEKKLDAALSSLEPKMQKKAIRYATREAGKVFRDRLRPLVPRDTGAMADAIQVRATSKTIKQGIGVYKDAVAKSGFAYTFEVKRTVGQEFGAKVEITRKSLAKQLSRRGLTAEADKVMSGKYFYPALVELGGRKREAYSPFRKTLEAQKLITVGIFRAFLAKWVQQETGKSVFG